MLHAALACRRRGAMVCRVLSGTVSFLALGALVAQATPAAPPPATASRVVARTFPAMGTEVTFSAYTSDPDRAEHAFTAAYEEIRRVERLMTDWERPGEPPSDIVRVNNAAGKKAVKVSAETIEVIDRRPPGRWPRAATPHRAPGGTDCGPRLASARQLISRAPED